MMNLEKTRARALRLPRVALVMALAVAIFLVSCDRPAESPEPAPTPTPTLLDNDAVENLIRVNSRLYSGGEPDEQTFDALRELGVRTVVSVDGARPKIEAAESRGMRYIHVPIGYDGLPEAARAQLARVAREADGPIYVHCHHGKHRGPSAAAIVACAMEDRAGAEWLPLLELAKTSPKYGGLWRDVEAFDPRSVADQSPELHSVVPVGDLAAEMAKIDRVYDHLKLMRKAGWRPDANHPDLAPAQEATILHEAFAELERLDTKEWPDDYQGWMRESRAAAGALAETLAAPEPDIPAAERHWNRVVNSCNACHVKYRN